MLRAAAGCPPERNEPGPDPAAASGRALPHQVVLQRGHNGGEWFVVEPLHPLEAMEDGEDLVVGLHLGTPGVTGRSDLLLPGGHHEHGLAALLRGLQAVVAGAEPPFGREGGRGEEQEEGKEA